MNVAPRPHFYGFYMPRTRCDAGVEGCPMNIIAILGSFYPERFAALQVGDVVRRPWVKEYDHPATILITKINKKTIKGVEIQGSYNPGTVWILNPETTLHLAPEYIPHTRLKEIAKAWDAQA